MNNKKFLQAFAVLSAILLFSANFSVFGKENSFSALESNDGNIFSSTFLTNENAEFDIFDLVNQERRRKRLGDLEWNNDLAKLARNYSKKMAREDFFDHYDSDGGSIIERANSARVKNWRKIGENLFFCHGINNYSGVAVKGWLKSASHRRNMLDREWTDTGIGVAKARDGRIYVTQVFIKR